MRELLCSNHRALSSSRLAHCAFSDRGVRIFGHYRIVALDTIPTRRYGADEDEINLTRVTMKLAQDSKSKLLSAALQVIRTKGYAATTVEDICQHAGVTKGSFFHHFKTKDELALAAIEHWNTMTGAYFASASYHNAKDPLDRLLGYVAFRGAILTGELPDYTCLLGTLVQETYSTHPDIRAACDAGTAAHIAELTRDIELAKKRYTPRASWSANSVGYFIQSVLQGAFIFAKARQSPEVIQESLAHLRRFLELLFKPVKRKAKETS